MKGFSEVSMMDMETIDGGGWGSVSVSDGQGGKINAGYGYVQRVDSSGTTTYLGYEGKTIIG